MKIIESMLRYVAVSLEIKRLESEKKDIAGALLAYHARYGAKDFEHDGMSYKLTYKKGGTRPGALDIDRLKADYPMIDFEKYKKVTPYKESISVTTKLI